MDDECLICLEPLRNNVAVLLCGHRYHFDCISSWANKKNNFLNLCSICPQENEIINVINENIQDNLENPKNLKNLKKNDIKSKTFCTIL